jgi:protein involved in polysaccharide export with SLBB domain
MNYQTKPVLLFLFALTILFVVPDLNAQSGFGFSADDLPTLQSEDITDAQLQMFVERAEQEGISIDNAFQMAVARGLRQSVASQLRTRIQQLPQDMNSGGMYSEGANEGVIEAITPEFRRPVREITEVMERTFGSEIFRWQQTEYAPLQNIPTPETYTLGPGDELSIYIWGDQTNTYNLTVTQDGTVMIENLGPVYVTGLNMKEANEVIKDRLRQLYSGLAADEAEQTTFARVSINRLRTIQVSVVGEAVNPGDYAIPSFSTVYNALYRAGGPDENGSYRQIRLIRNNKVHAEFDLYHYLTEGLQEGNVQLRDGDVIQIPTFLNRVEVMGETKRNDLFFEMRTGETLSDLIQYAGGFSEKAYTRQIKVHRNTTTERKIITVDGSKLNETVLENGDVIYIDEILERFSNRVSIAGAVWRSGEFERTPGMTVKDLIEEADGVRPDAFMQRGLINRMNEDYTYTQISFDVASMMGNDGADPVTLQPEDHVIIRSIHEVNEEQTVTIEGAVNDGGSFYYRSGMTLEDLILKSKGFMDAASEGRIEISRRISGDAVSETRSSRSAEIFTFSVDRDLSIQNGNASFQLQPFDRVFVHRRPDFREQQTVTIEGEVLYPGTYTIESRDERISDIIQRAGGLTSEAYPAGARLLRQVTSIDRPRIDLEFLGINDEEELGFGAAAEQERAEREREESSGETAENDQEDSRESIAMRRAALNRTDSLDINAAGSQDEGTEAGERRIGIDLEQIMRNRGSAEDLFVREGDVIRIPEALQTVGVAGAVMQPVEIRYQPGKNLNYYIDRAGGYAENARSKRGYVVYANGNVDRRKRYLFGLIKNNPPIEPGAQIIIPMKPEREGMSTGEIISVSATVVSMTTTLLIAIDRLSR